METESEAAPEQVQFVPETVLPALQEAVLQQATQPESERAAEFAEPQAQAESIADESLSEVHVAKSAPSTEVRRSSEAERLHQAVERVFDRFKPLLVAAIVRELARHDQ
jgi:hypothetical protein